MIDEDFISMHMQNKFIILHIVHIIRNTWTCSVIQLLLTSNTS